MLCIEDEINDPVKKFFRVKFVGTEGPQSYMLVYLVGLRVQCWVHRFISVVKEASPFGCLGGSLYFLEK